MPIRLPERDVSATLLAELGYWESIHCLGLECIICKQHNLLILTLANSMTPLQTIGTNAGWTSTTLLLYRETANLTDNPFSVNLIFREISSEGGKFLRSRKMLERKKTVFIPFFREIISERNKFASFTENSLTENGFFSGPFFETC